jgi:hypothetical protein
MTFHVGELIIYSQVDELLELCRMHHAAGYPHLEMNEEKVRFVADKVIADVDREFYNVFLLYKDDELVGYGYAYITQYTFSTQRNSTLEFIFLKPAVRSIKAFLKVLRKYEEWARLRGSVEMHVGVGLNDIQRADRISNLYEKVGYKRFGYIHKKRA